MEPFSKQERALINPLFTESKQGNRGATAIPLAAAGRYPLIARIHAVARRECGWRQGGARRVCGAAPCGWWPGSSRLTWGGGSTFSRLGGNFNLEWKYVEVSISSDHSLVEQLFDLGQCQRDQTLCIALSYVYLKVLNLFVPPVAPS
jgi:hypothetical protein